MAKESEIEIEGQEGLPELIAEADAVFSRYIRMKAAGKDGYLNCYICDKRVRWQDAQNMHYIPRGSSFLRFDEKRNCRAGCKECNEYKGGNLAAYGKRLELEMPGLTEIILEESRLPYKLTREEVRLIISEYTSKINNLK